MDFFEPAYEALRAVAFDKLLDQSSTGGSLVFQEWARKAAEVFMRISFAGEPEDLEGVLYHSCLLFIWEVLILLVFIYCYFQELFK